MAKLTPKRAVTPEDLESLVRGLGGLVRESVREEVRDQLKPLIEALRARGQIPDARFDAIHDALDRGEIDVENAKRLLEIAK